MGLAGEAAEGFALRELVLGPWLAAGAGVGCFTGVAGTGLFRAEGRFDMERTFGYRSATRSRQRK